MGTDVKAKVGVNKYKIQQMIITVLPLVALVGLFFLFCGVVQSKGYRLDMYLKIHMICSLIKQLEVKLNLE